MRRYRDSKEAFPHLVNAGKYSTTFLVVIFATLRAYHASEYVSTFDNPYTICWLLSSALASTYAYVWDIKMDWGLFDKNAGENRFLREEVVYSSHVRHIYPHLQAVLLNSNDSYSLTNYVFLIVQFSPFVVLLLFCDNRRLIPAIHLDTEFYASRSEARIGRIVTIRFSTT